MQIRPETASDSERIANVHRTAFPSPDEATLVDKLRGEGNLIISLVAEDEDLIAGHIAFSPVTIDGKPGGLGLAPVAVLPEHQQKGIGSDLIRAGIEKANELGVGYLVVLGHRSYYPRFGFETASKWNLANEYDANDAFMAMELQPGSIPADGGLVKYGAAFAVFS
jgi:putative acetyltransferase